MADRLTTRINRLKRDMRSMRRWAALERWLGVLVVVLALAGAFWFWQNNGRSGAIVAPPVSAAPAPAGPAVPPPAPMSRGQTEPDVVSAPTGSGSDEVLADAAQHVARFGDVEISVESAAVTNMVLTEFFGISAVDPDAALVIVVRVANLGLTDRVRYTTMRIGSSVVDDVGRRYTGREYGAIPAGGMAAAVIEPGDVITDVLIFDAPATDASYVDLIVPGRCVGAASTRAIRVPAELLEIALEVRPDPAEALPRRPAPQPPVAPPGPPPGELVAGYRLAAEQGDPEGLWNLGRAYRDGFGIPRDPRKALKQFRAAGQKDHPQAMWDAVQMLIEGDGIASDPHQAGQWLKRLMKLGDRQAHFELAGLDPSQYCDAARTLRLVRAGVRNEPGSAVKVGGRLREPDGDTWTMILENRRTIDVNMSEIADPHVAEGIYAEVCGILNHDLVIEALVGEIPEPVYYLERPMVDVPIGGVIAHRTAQYVMRGVVRNTGRQPIRAITLTLRVRVGSSVSPIQVVTVYDLSPGASAEYSATFTMRNPNVTSRPVAEITQHTYDW